MDRDPINQISFDDAEALILRRGPEFTEQGVVGVGVSPRNNGICFVISVEDERTRERLIRKHRGRDVEGFPVLVEVESLVPAIGADLDALAATPPQGLLREVLDRPGYLIVAGLTVAIACAAWLTLAF